METMLLTIIAVVTGVLGLSGPEPGGNEEPKRTPTAGAGGGAGRGFGSKLPKHRGQRLLRERLRRSHIALMPEGWPESAEAFRPLSPGVVAWGDDPVFFGDDQERMRQRVEQLRSIGVELIASNVFMLTATSRELRQHPELREAVCVDVAGEPIIPSWQMDSFQEGMPNYWGCTNNPAFRQQVRERVTQGVSAGANMLHLDDHMGSHASILDGGGCFCEHCLAGFRQWLRDRYSEEELAGKGIGDIASFDYRQMVREAGFDTREALRKGAGRRTAPRRAAPLAGDFIAYQREAAVDFVRELGELAAEVAGKPVPVGVNAWNLEPIQLADSHQADYFANEVQQLEEGGKVPPLVYKLAEALGKPVFATGTGENWSFVSERGAVTLVRRWIATAHALGQHFMYSHNKWCWSKEKGTHWYTTPIETYLPVCRFIAQNAELFDEYEAVAQVGVLYSDRACYERHWEVRDACWGLLNANIPFGIAVAGGDWLRHELTEAELSAFEVLVVPEPAMLDGEQERLVSSWARRGKEHGSKVVKWESAGEGGGARAAQVASRVVSLVSLRSGDGVWVLPRKIPGRRGAPVVVHLLNQDYDADADAMREKRSITVGLGEGLFDGAEVAGVTYLTIDAEPKALPFRKERGSKERGGIEVTVPELDLWGILRVDVAG